jgi:hypothetical protein
LHLAKSFERKRLNMRKLEDVWTRQHVGAVATLNNTPLELPPAFNKGQKPPDSDMMDVMASKAHEDAHCPPPFS